MSFWKQLFYKWFGLTVPPCEVCEVLQMQLAKSESERQDLLRRLLDPVKTEPLPTIQEEFKPITPQFVPWRTRQQMFEAEDRAKAKIIKDRENDIAQLEKELQVGEVK